MPGQSAEQRAGAGFQRQQAKNPPAASVEEKARRAYPDVQKPQDVYIKPVVVDGTITLPTQTRHTAGSQWLPLEEEP